MLVVSMVLGAQQTTQPVFKASSSVYKTEQEASKNATLTGWTFQGLRVWQGPKGGYYVIRKSKKTGNYYRSTVKKIN